MARSFVFHAPIRKKNCGKLRLLEISGSIGNAFDSKFPRDSLGGEISRLPWLKVETELTSPPWSSTSARTRSASRDFRQRFSPPRFWHLNVSLSLSRFHAIRPCCSTFYCGDEAIIAIIAVKDHANSFDIFLFFFRNKKGNWKVERIED